MWLNGDNYKNGKYRKEFYGSIPSILFQCKNMEILYISNNGITSIPKDITNLKNLQVLFLSDNSLNQFLIIGELTNITQLNLSSNNLKEIPVSLIKLNKLENLDLSGNKELQFPPISLVKSCGSNYAKQASVVIKYLKTNKSSTIPPLSEFPNLNLPKRRKKHRYYFKQQTFDNFNYFFSFLSWFKETSIWIVERNWKRSNWNSMESQLERKRRNIYSSSKEDWTCFCCW